MIDFAGSRGQAQGTMSALVKRAIKSGALRKEIDPSDLLRALIGVSYVPSGPEWQRSARRLVDILIAGSRRVKSGRIS
ncbi:MAG TPA: hypothetical protein VFE01_03760 [Terracidiphilus sp.]|jgi:hypothetical protein|nr:hypothetical protein [Terracidiphilus sp.]